MHALRKNGNTLYRVGVIVFVFLTLLGFAGSTFAQVDAKYTPLVGIPGVTDLDKDTPLPDYINAIYIVLITVGALWGVIKIVFAGVKYSLSDIVTDKSDAKDDIKGVLLGLILLLLPWVVLNEIYPDLTSLNILGGAKELSGNSSSSNTQRPTDTPYTTPAGTINSYCDFTPKLFGLLANSSECVSDCLTKKKGKIVHTERGDKRSFLICQHD